MPIYEYECPNCQFREEKLIMSPKRAIRPKCPICGQAKMDKIISLSTFKLKGKGWYATDYGNKKPTDNKRCTPDRG